jgi:hypothetical protein
MLLILPILDSVSISIATAVTVHVIEHSLPAGLRSFVTLLSVRVSSILHPSGRVLALRLSMTGMLSLIVSIMTIVIRDRLRIVVE